MTPLTDSELQTIREIAELSLTDTSRMSKDVAPYVIRAAIELQELRKAIRTVVEWENEVNGLQLRSDELLAAVLPRHE